MAFSALIWSVVLAAAQSAPTPSAPVVDNLLGQAIEVGKLLLLAAPGYLVARRQAKKEEQAGQAARDEGLVTGFQTMSMQARDHLTRVYEDLAREREARHTAEEGRQAAEARVAELEQELEELRRKGGVRAERGVGD